MAHAKDSSSPVHPLRIISDLQTLLDKWVQCGWGMGVYHGGGVATYIYTIVRGWGVCSGVLGFH